MKRAKKSVAAHGNGGSRNYLADEVKAQRGDITDLSEKVAGIDKRVEGQTVALATLIEDSHRARDQRDKMWDAINASRSETGQVAMAVSAIPALQIALDKISKTLADHETERQQRAGAFALAKASARLGWGIVGGIFLALVAGIVAALKYLPFIPKPPQGGP